MKKITSYRILTLALVGILWLSACAPAEATPPAPTRTPAASPPPPIFAPLPTPANLLLPEPVEVTADAGSAIRGQVVDLGGLPISGASVQTDSAKTTTDSNGAYTLPTTGYPQWVTVTHPAYISRTRAAAPDLPLLIRLTPDDGQTISLLFAGDVMFGRRFFDIDENGDFSDGLLPVHPSAADHLRLLEGIRPLLENADLTFVNLESPLSDNPALDYTQVRPEEYHQTKEYVYATHPSALTALQEAGVDLLGMANNHVFDLLGLGVENTLQALDAAGFASQQGYFGIGDTPEEAWLPAVWQINGQTFAFLGCTVITGERFEENFIAEEGKSGAAACREAELTAAVSAAAAQYDNVIMMIHGGHEINREPSENQLRWTALARQMGADLVINHHSHVISGLDWDGDSLVAWSLGNFIFDQDVWPTFESCILVVHLRQGEVVNAYMEPLMIEDYQPTGVTGELADTVGREIAGRSQGPFVLVNGAVELELTGFTQPVEQAVTLDGGAAPGSIYPLATGEWVAGFSGPGSLRLGRDQLWVGAFEDEDVDTDWLESTFWFLEPPYREVSPEHAYAGAGGAGLQRGAQNTEATFLSHFHRIKVTAGGEYSIIGMVRSSENAASALQVSWYAETRGASEMQVLYPLPNAPAGEWLPFRVDVTVPEGMVAIGLYFKLNPPLNGFSEMALDNLRLIEWASPEAAFSPLYNFYWLTGEGTVRLRIDRIP